MNNMRNKILSLLVLLLTAATGAWAAQVELKLGAKIKNGDVLTFGSTRVHFTTPCSRPYAIFSAVNTSTNVAIGYDVNGQLGYMMNDTYIAFTPLVDVSKGQDDYFSGEGLSLGINTGQTIPPYVMVTEGTGTYADPFILIPYATYNCGGSPVDGKAICDASDPDAISLTSSDGVTWTLAEGLLDSDMELLVEYLKEPGLAWKGNIPEGGFDAYLGFFHPSALPSLKNPNALTGITYSSSKTDVATVDENTGVVTALKAGSTIITATFAGDDTYQAASISYTLNIDNPAIVTLPTSTDEGGTVTLVAGAGSSAQDGDNLIATNANLEGANTSRNIAVGTDGSIHVVYKNTVSEAVMYKKSTDGITFSEPVQVSTEGGNECEVAVSSNGKVYVSYTTGSGGYIAYSTDGSSFTSKKVAENNINSIHIAVDGDYVYGIEQNGTEFYYSADGGQNYATHTGWTGYMYSDVLIDKSNNNVVVIKDDPSVVVRYSTDHGATFTNEQPVMNGEQQLNVFFSTAAAGAGKVFISGSSGTIATVNYINATYTQTTIEQTDNRSLCADEDENVIVGVEQGGSLYYELSTDGAQTFGEKVLVSEGSGANAALNTHDGSLLYLFTKDTDLYLAVKTGVVSTETVIDNGDGTYTVMPGTQVTFIAKANDGYYVKSWSNNVEVNDPQEATQTITVSGDLNISATFAENEYNVEFAEGTNTSEWTATPNPAKTKATVTVTYTGTKKVLGVKAEKKSAAPAEGKTYTNLNGGEVLHVGDKFIETEGLFRSTHDQNPTESDYYTYLRSGRTYEVLRANVVYNDNDGNYECTESPDGQYYVLKSTFYDSDDGWLTVYYFYQDLPVTGTSDGITVTLDGQDGYQQNLYTFWVHEPNQ